ncbi:hypothetical protein TVAG_214910 [Trichomonas vaginalis G3]|uniref:Uncharacterized protein n=1 Tax=Trichomonas vaginalis (strain ATCC PRA-98 / G3) TaxID=412133 RepID=A2DK95_TRIV3|nr:Ankyrin repeat family [Trichomonas vaginalis G3]EAY19266.1 hypothetical protein TVAG_214910 [Trichomonas vaginalis G3]KAI5548574.1 Ankyrin repeat family [Trichomonas vaginalis G3]|eukprot:XP_001580252.1 hypothetical protein [Trichomonas vaginalis G3]
MTKNKEIAEFLISHGANVNAKARGGYTALNFSDMLQNKEMAELLISHGAIRVPI